MPDRPDRPVRPSRRRRPSLLEGARRAAPGVVLLLGLAAAAGGCSSGGGEPASSTASAITLPGTLSIPAASGTSAVPAPAPTTGPDGSGASGPLGVTDFVVRAPATCAGASYTASLSWTATGATAATVLVDGAQVAAPVPVGGPFDVVLGCNGSAHAVTLVVADGAGGTAIRTQAVSATPEG